MTLQEHVNFLKTTSKLLEEATSYSKEHILKNSIPLDSTYTEKDRLEFVKKAESLFISHHQKDILKLAIDIINNELASVGL